MHEMSVALNIIDIASESALNAKAGKVNEVEIEVGRLAGIEFDALSFALESAKRDTILEDAVMRIVIVEPNAVCLDCNERFDVENLYTSCPNCGEYNIYILSGRELKVKSLDVD